MAKLVARAAVRVNDSVRFTEEVFEIESVNDINSEIAWADDTSVVAVSVRLTDSEIDCT